MSPSDWLGGDGTRYGRAVIIADEALKGTGRAMKPEHISKIPPDMFQAQTDRDLAKGLFKRHVDNVILELFDYCNRQCPYCPVSLVDRMSDINHISPDHFKKVVDDLIEIDYANHICLNLYNEPMADPFLFTAIEQLRDAVPKASLWFNTNGDYANKETLDRLAEAGLKRLVVTLHVEKTKTYDDLQQLSRFTQFAARTGFNLTFERYKPGYAITVAGRHRGIVIKVKSANYAVMGENRAGLMEDIPVAAKRNAPCDRPLGDFTVSWNGNVYPCRQFFSGLEGSDPYMVRNIGEADSIYQLYTSSLMSSFRTDLLGYGPKQKPCDTCSEWDKYGGKEDERVRAAAVRLLGIDAKEAV